MSSLSLVLPILLFLSVLISQSLQTHAFCPTPLPPLKTPLIVRTKLITQLPKEKGSPAGIISIKPYPGTTDLAVCTLTRIYRVRLTGVYTLLLDVEESFRRATGRNLNYENKAHGGLRSVAFHPDFARNRLLYISAMEDRPNNPGKFNYISDIPGKVGSKDGPIEADSVLVEYKMRSGKIDPASYRLLFRVGMKEFDHPIKQIEFFGRLLYIAHGDGSVQSAFAGGGQNNDALGKILRIDPIRRNNAAYGIPPTNVFPNRRKPRMPAEVFAYGFRNPHNLCFNRRGVLFVADTGRDNYEEVNLVYNGRNYGWSEREGTCVHLIKGGGIQKGVKPLPRDDAKFGYEYPVAQYTHAGTSGKGFIGVAIAGGCPVENRSPMGGKYWYADFPMTGKLYYSELSEIFKAKTRGPPQGLTQARTKRARIWFAGKVYDNLHDILVADREFADNTRVDVRLGYGIRGELYWSSKRNGRIYMFTSSLRGARI